MVPSELRISVIYALPEQQAIVPLAVPEGTTVAEAVERSGLMRRFPEIGSRPLACAVYGKAVQPSHCVTAGDRIEILRPLAVDPKEARRRRSR